MSLTAALIKSNLSLRRCRRDSSLAVSDCVRSPLRTEAWRCFAGLSVFDCFEHAHGVPELHSGIRWHVWVLADIVED